MCFCGLGAVRRPGQRRTAGASTGTGQDRTGQDRGGQRQADGDRAWNLELDIIPQPATVILGYRDMVGPSTLNGSVQLCASPCDSVWFRVAPYGSVWLRTAPCGSVWLGATLCGSPACQRSTPATNTNHSRKPAAKRRKTHQTVGLAAVNESVTYCSLHIMA